MPILPLVARIAPTSPRAPDWREVFGRDTVQLRSPLPVRATAPGIPDGLFYEVDVAALTGEQFERAVGFLSRRFQRPAEEVRHGLLHGEGLPILAVDVSVSLDARLVL